MRSGKAGIFALFSSLLLAACSSGGSNPPIETTSAASTAVTAAPTADPADAGDSADAAPDGETDAGEHEAGPPPPPPSYLDPEIMDVDFSADGNIAVVSHDREVIVLDPKAHTEKRLGPFAGAISAVRFAPSGDMFAVGERTGRVELWSAKTGAALRSFEASTSAVVAVRFSTDGKLAVALPENGPLRVFRPESGEKVADFESESLVDAAFLRAARKLVGVNSAFAMGFDLTDRPAGDAAPNKEPETLLLDTGGTFPAAVSPDGLWMASAAADGHGLRVWSASPFASHKQLLTVNSCNEHIIYVAFSRDGKTLLARQQNGVQYAFHTKGDWSLRSRWTPPSGVVETAAAIAVSAEGELYAAATTSEAGESKLRVFSTTSDGRPRAMEGKERLRELRFSPGNRYLLGVLDGYKGARVWSTSDGKVVARFDVTP